MCLLEVICVCPVFILCYYLFSSVYGNLPSQSQLADWEFAVTQHSAVPQGILVSLSVCVLIEIQILVGKRFVFSE